MKRPLVLKFMTGVVSAPRRHEMLPLSAPFHPPAGNTVTRAPRPAPQRRGFPLAGSFPGAQSRRAPCERPGREDPRHLGRARSSGPGPAPCRGLHRARPGAAGHPRSARLPASARVRRATGVCLRGPGSRAPRAERTRTRARAGRRPLGRAGSPSERRPRAGT